MQQNSYGDSPISQEEQEKTSKQDHQRDYVGKAIAIIGMACRFPKADSVETFWNNLRDGVDAVTVIPKDRWNRDYFVDQTMKESGKSKTFHGGFLEQIDQFDASFFGISPREAAHMDPQQRLLMELTWETIEDAGKPFNRIRGSKTGVFIGAFTVDYQLKALAKENLSLVDVNTSSGCMSTLLANRLSWWFDFRGPSMVIDTACSSSLVATHLACEALQHGDCEMAMAGGVNILLAPQYFIAKSQAGFLSPSGRCRSFDQKADGYVRSEGGGIVLLKLLTTAIADGDTIHAIIRSSAVNSDGHTGQLTAPCKEAQLEVMRQACQRAGIKPDEVSYVEAHGTGTPVGDPIEMDALGTLLFEGRTKRTPCLIGSLKSNIGHTEAAAGIAGLIKTVMILKKKEIPPNLHLKKVNPTIPFSKYNLKIPPELEPWPKHNDKAIAGVNSFGFGGTNAHVILEDSPTDEKERKPIPERSLKSMILPLSAKTPKALRDRARQFARQLLQPTFGKKAALYDLCYSAAIHADHHPCRAAIVGKDREEMVNKLHSLLNRQDKGSDIQNGKPIVFVYSGMGPQWWGMGQQLLKENTLFREVIERCDREFSKYTDWSLLKEMNRPETCSKMTETWLAQPANFAIQLGLTALWKSWGVKPDLIVGHSAGEVAAFYEAGVIDWEDIVSICFHRGRLLHKASGTGTMLAVGLSANEILPFITDHEASVSIGAINSPENVTLSGEFKALKIIAKQLEKEDIFYRFLRVDVPYHSHFLESQKEPFLSSIREFLPKQSKVPLFSSVTGTELTGAEADRNYWWKNFRNPVLFSSAIEQILEHPEEEPIFLEISPHPVLSASVTEVAVSKRQRCTTIETLNRKKSDEWEALTESLLSLYTLGTNIEWSALYPIGNRRSLPHYPWQRERYWSESEESKRFRLRKPEHPLLQIEIEDPDPTWETELNQKSLPWIKDHQVRGHCLFPGAAYVEMALFAARKVYGTENFAIENLHFQKAIFIDPNKRTTLRLSIDRQRASFSIRSRSQEKESQWETNATGQFYRFQDDSASRSIHRKQSSMVFEKKAKELYQTFRQQGLEYGPRFQLIRGVKVEQKNLITELQLPKTEMEALLSYRFYPALLDAWFQTTIATFSTTPKRNRTFLPVSIGRFFLYHRPESKMWSHTKVVEETEHYRTLDLSLYGSTGNVIAEVEGIRVQSMETGSNKTSLQKQNQSLLSFDWEERELPPALKRTETSSKQRWLLFADRAGIASRFANLLKSRGEEVVLVYHGDRFQQIFTGNLPCYESDLSNLYRLRDREHPFSKVVHFWNLDIKLDHSVDPEKLKRWRQIGCYSIIQWFKICGPDNKNARLWVITQASQEIAFSSLKNGNPFQAGVWGLGRVLGHQERINSWGGMIDLDAAEEREAANRIYQEILHENKEDQIAFRHGKRFVARLKQHKEVAPSMPVRLRKEGAYLVTGAFGSLGMLCAKWLVTKGAKRLILLGRNTIPEREEWKTVPSESAIEKRIQFVQDLEAEGVTVHPMQVDLSDESSLFSSLQQYEQEKNPPIIGVIHTAGVVRDHLLEDMDETEFHTAFDAKATGAWLLHQWFKKQRVDFFILFSSIASWITTSGQSNYAAANAQLDAIAYHRRKEGYPALSINWGAWEVGMAETEKLRDYFDRSGRGILNQAEGIDTMERLLGQEITNIGVAPISWNKLIENWPGNRKLFSRFITKNESAELPETVLDQHERVLSQNSDSDRLEIIEEVLAVILGKVMHTEPEKINRTLPLDIMGLESMMATQLRFSIEKELKVELPIMEFLSGSHLRTLAKKVLEQLGEKKNGKY